MHTVLVVGDLEGLGQLVAADTGNLAAAEYIEAEEDSSVVEGMQNL